MDGVNDINEAGSSSTELPSWVAQINEKLSKPERVTEILRPRVPKNSIINRLPDHIRAAYDYLDLGPQTVSFGPYHHQHWWNPQREKIKEHVLLRFLMESGKPLNDYVIALREVVQPLKNAYDDLNPAWLLDDDAFLKLMVYDGCFLLGILTDSVTIYPETSFRFAKELNEAYKHDMMLLENQLPMDVLVKLRAVQTGKTSEEAIKDVNWLILSLLCPPLRATKIPKTRTYSHVLDLYRHSLIYQENSDKNASNIAAFKMLLGTIIHRLLKFPIRHLEIQSDTEFNFNIPSATDLKDARIEITMSEAKSPMDISFSRGNLKLPQLSVDDATLSRFINIIAYEHMYLGAGHEFTSYIYFISCLVRGANDVNILQSRGIIDSDLPNDVIAELFMSLKKIVRNPDIFLVPHYRKVGKRLAKSFDRLSKEWQKDLWQNYIRSPLGFVSLVVTFLLFTLAAVQTVYAVLSHHK